MYIAEVGMFDFIDGFDAIEKIYVLDAKRNRYGVLLHDFLISSQMCILNSRNAVNNDVTSISEKSLAIVDYSFVPI